MAKELICPHCKKGLSPAGGFEHDENLNMLCGHCKGVVYAATKEVEAKVKHLLQKTDTTQTWQRRDCLPIRMQQSSTIINSDPKPSSSYSGYEMYGD